MNSVPFDRIRLEDGFWKQKQDLVRSVTIHSVYDRFKETGRIDAFRCDWQEGQPKPHIFWDSDVYKWLESVAYLLAEAPDAALEAQAHEIIDNMEKNQLDDGYFNIRFQQVEPQARFTRRSDHELYCLGHAIEAAVAWHYIGQDTLLHIVERYLALVRRLFMEEKSTGFTTPGHEEIELALIRLYRVTKAPEHLELCRFFLDNRGTGIDPATEDKEKAAEDQSHLPVREQTEAKGHAVRAMYLYCAMADLAAETGDTALKDACIALFEDVVRRKMYITGGIGSLHELEQFSEPYFLPHHRAYAETCASIGLALFSHRMLQLGVRSVYADTVERALYNGVLSGLSLDGTAFFYVNPLELRPEICRVLGAVNAKVPLTHRVHVFDCSCCPPNLTRILPRVQQFCYTAQNDCLYVHQFMASTGEVSVNGQTVTVRQETDYPHSGKVTLTVSGYTGSLAVRVPGWSQAYSAEKADDGYLYTAVNGTACITLDFGMPVRRIEADPRVWDACGRVALCRGPVVYCMESVDNGPALRDIRLSEDAVFTEEPSALCGLPLLHTVGKRRPATGALYAPRSGALTEVPLTFIPYHAFANREESEMLIWVQEA